MSKFLTVLEVAEELKVSPGRVRQLLSEGRLKAQKFGRWMRKRFQHEKPSRIKYLGISLREN